MSCQKGSSNNRTINQAKLTAVWHIVALWSLADGVNGLNVFLGELNLLEVVPDAGRRHTLGDDGMFAQLRPSDDDVGRRDSQLLGDLLDLRVRDQKRFADGVVAEGLEKNGC